MVLDEAQAIKSSNSIRWKTLLSFNCRNMLLLTGTPIQNNMAELWALPHFIMPTLFDSHEQFNEWFSKGIESHAEHGGTLNEHQLNRLVSIFYATLFLFETKQYYWSSNLFQGFK
ncbi:chromatin-remodeling ATPase INO80-like [Humulus lupulus]|uniref:chromatin-remodeling ATPase INO80-like n=1 Tax=Humulus lupulus TaxID=3486 RepID=UPI002B41700C|nr:chromatin-remodeling ATPase INO80-like [Humulus lupulus]